MVRINYNLFSSITQLRGRCTPDGTGSKESWPCHANNKPNRNKDKFDTKHGKTASKKQTQGGQDELA